MSWPNLFLLAAPRSGSTQLARWLDSHADIALSMVKEPNYFSAHDFPPDYVARTHLDDCPPTGPPPRPAQFAVFRDTHAYHRLFAPLTTRWRLDASTSYLACPEAPAAIARAIPDARVILLTRDPVARAVSHYRLARRTGRTRSSLSQELREEEAGTLPPAARYLLRPSFQAEAAARVHAAFPEMAILSLTFEDLIAAPDRALARIAAHLDIPAQFDLSRQARNAAALPRLEALNAVALRSGAKTALRRILPPGLRPLARRLWFRDGAVATVAPEEVDRLRRLLDGA